MRLHLPSSPWRPFVLRPVVRWCRPVSVISYGALFKICRLIFWYLHSKRALIPEIQWLFAVLYVLVDSIINDFLHTSDDWWLAKLKASIRRCEKRTSQQTSRILVNRKLLDPVNASYTGLTEMMNCRNMITLFTLCSVCWMVTCFGMTINCRER